MKGCLKSTSFKKQLPRFFADEWQSIHYASILQDNEIYLDIPGSCYRFSVHDGAVVREEVPTLVNNHEEADTKVILHALSADEEGKDIVIRGSDTDIAVIVLHHCVKFKSKLYMDVETTNKRRRCVSLSNVAAAIGEDMCGALPGLHAFTGTDYTSAFVRKGKIKPYKLLEKNQSNIVAFNALSSSSPLSDTEKETINKFTAVLYLANEGTDLDNWCVKKFEHMRQRKQANPFFLDYEE